MKLIRVLVITIELLIMFTYGAFVGYKMTMENIKAYTEDQNVIVLEVYGQEWVYEE